MPAAWMKGISLETPNDVVLGGDRSATDCYTQSSIGVLTCIHLRLDREDSWVACMGRR